MAEKGFGNYLRYLYQNQLQTIGLVAGQVILLGLSIANVLSLYLSSPIVIALALFTGYLQYSRASGEKIHKILRDLRRHVAEFSKFNFEARTEGEDFRIITLLDRIRFPTDSATDPWREIVLAVPEVKRLQDVFKLWHSTITDNMGIMSHVGASLRNADLVRSVEDFATFYNSYVDIVAERVVQLLNRPPVLEREHQIRSVFSVYRENMGHLRDRMNRFLADLRDSGFILSTSEVRALRTELISRASYA